MNEHIAKETLEKLYIGALPLDEQIQVLEHLGTCDYCAQQFANITESHELLRAPKNFKESIFVQIDTLPVQLSVKTHTVSKRLELLYYSIKVSTAVVCTLLLLTFVYTPGLIPATPQIHFSTQIKDKTNHLTTTINQFSTNLIHREDNNYD